MSSFSSNAFFARYNFIFENFFGGAKKNPDLPPQNQPATPILKEMDSTDKSEDAKLEKNSKKKIGSHNMIMIKTSWSNRNDLQPSPPSALSSEIEKITNFKNLKGNPYSNVDLIKSINRNFCSPNSVINYQWHTGWHRGINSRNTFAEISHPASNGTETSISEGSYTLLKYNLGYPKSSGQSPKHLSLLNNDWKSFDQSKNQYYYFSQLTPELEEIEDKSVQLDIEIERNKSVYRLLLFHGPEALLTTPVVVDELNAIYPNRGDFFLSLLKNESIAASFRLILLKRLKVRAKELYLKKIERQSVLAKGLEKALPIQRTKYQIDIVTDIIRDEINYIEAKKIEYPIQGVVLLAKLVNLISPNEANSTQFKYILTELRMNNQSIHLTYLHALSLYIGALFLKKLFSFDLIDHPSSKSLNTALDIGLTEFDRHGYLNILRLIASTFKRNSNKTTLIDNAIQNVAALSLSLNYIKACKIVKFGIIFYKVLKEYEKDSPISPPMMTAYIDNGTLSLHLDHGGIPKFDIHQYHVYNAKLF